MLTGSDIRQKFLSFFESKGHAIVPSSSLVPSNDPTLMFTAAGMVQFKNVFTGVEKRDYTRATSSQRCVRAGGKHNDLENVGHTARHHTFFEMLGNFSFGDYFKEDAIPFAWEFLTSKEWLGIDASKLYITIYHTDDEAYDIWNKKVGVDDSRIIRIATDDNFWSAGDTGPCGPCTEIFYDHGEQYWGGLPGTPEEDGDRFIEIWNVVFMQYDRQADGELKPLAAKGVDTGSGLERLTAVMQGVNSNYDIDMMQILIQAAVKLVGKPYFSQADNTQTDEQRATSDSYRVIADHLRAMSFLMVDGVMPSNEGRGYVLRRIMRRAMRHVNLLGVNEPMIYKLVPALTQAMGEHYTELGRAESMIMDMVKLEEERFLKTLSKGLEVLEGEINSSASQFLMKHSEGAVTTKMDSFNMSRVEELNYAQQYWNRVYGTPGEFPGEVAFKLYDTYGFPLDLTQDILKSYDISVDVDGFNAEMEKQRERSRAGGMGGTGQSKLAPVWFDIEAECGETEFLGYAMEEAEGSVLALVKDDTRAESLKVGEEGVLITNQTPFYGESGGQVGDTGGIRTASGYAKVLDTQKVVDGKIIQHKIRVEEGEIKPSQTATLKVCKSRRLAIRRNHSATHLMHAVLKDVLGEHVFQKGSVVDAKRLRFDFSQPKALTAEDILEVEKRVNAMIWANKPIRTRLMDKEEAVEAGAIALFGEKYDSQVRVLFMGDDDAPFSIELCGGTHASATGEIGLFKIVSESAVSAGVRRIEALTGKGAIEYYNAQETALREAASSLKASTSDVAGRIEALQAEIKKLKQDVKDAKKNSASVSSPSDLVQVAEDISGYKFVSALFEGMEAGELREMVDEIKNQLGSGVVLLASNNGDKSSIVAGVTKDLVAKVKAGEVVNAAAGALGGKGGGRPDMAMAGGKSGDLSLAQTAARAFLAS